MKVSTALTHDGGVDVEAQKKNELGFTVDYIIQLKHWETTHVGKEVVTSLAAKLTDDDKHRHYALLITTSRLTGDAKDEMANKGRLSAIEGEELFDMCSQNELGVRSVELGEFGERRGERLLFLDPEWFDDLERQT
ncbi:MAG: restriction endonuclease [Chloroflexi bacterium]|nr:restriction endonuclease [Chloroflexota bacterium]